MRRNRILFLSFIVALFFISACNLSQHNQRDKKYGGTFHVNATDVPEIIFPGRVLKESEQLIINQVYSGLIKYNATNLQIVPSLAKKWRVERNNSLYTFYLNSNAYFHSDACFGKEKTRKIVASDVKYSIEKIAMFHIISNHGISTQLKNIKGSDAFITSELPSDSLGISGIIAVNDTTLVFELSEPDELFLHFLAGTNSLVFAKEAFNAYGFKSTVGSGAYVFDYPSIKGQTMTLIANPVYFGVNQQNQKLPFIDTIKVSFITSAPKELAMFENGQLDMVVGVYGDYVSNFLDKHINEFQSNPPYYVMKLNTNSDNITIYNFIRSNIRDIQFNSLHYFDFSYVYFKEPDKQEIKLE